FNKEGTKLASGISYNGSDWQEIRIKNLLTDEDYPEVLEWCKFTQIAWTKDDKGFYYNRYPSQDSFSFKDSSYYNKLYWHTLETSQEEDMVIYEDNEQKELSFSPTISDDNKYLLLHVNNGTEPKTYIYYRLLDSNDSFTALFKERTDSFFFLGNEGHIFYFYTNINAP